MEKLTSFIYLLMGVLWGCTTYELPTKNNPYDSEAQTTEVCPEENPDCIQDCTGLWGGTAYLDDCGTCVGGRTNVKPCRCGDGETNPELGEECDTKTATETCDADCTLPRCGDGIVNVLAGELCDDGNQIETDGCVSGENAACVWAACGDGIVQPIQGEQCDDGNTVTETCVYGDQTCTVCNQACQEQTLTGTYCGDGVAQDTEVCDDGNNNDGDYCSSDCQAQTSVCGDSLIQGNEACDDGNLIVENCSYGQRECTVCGDACTLVNGAVAYCGDGIRNGDEACDDGNFVTESCSYGQAQCEVCSAACELVAGEVSLCGDGIVQGLERCDDGNLVTEVCLYGQESCEVCSDACTLEPGMTAYCGDGTLNGSEMCDDGNAVTEACAYNSEACTVCNETCQEVAGTPLFCGDGIVSDGETCDDGNNITESCPYNEASCEVCNSVCQLEAGAVRVCGDGRVDLGFETCDDGNANTEYCSYNEESCIVCDASCTYVEGERSYCGDGRVTDDEVCDDGSYINSEKWRRVATCNDTCSAVAPYCGDGVIQFPETCDDPNDVDCNAWCHYGPEEMMFIPEGPFFMGCKDQFDPADCETEAGCEPRVDTACAYDDNSPERPGRVVTLDAFYIDEFEISADDYLGCVNAGACGYRGPSYEANGSNYWDPSTYESPFANLAMNHLNWYEAVEFCAWRGKRLPTEAEWEKSARGLDKRTYPWGNEAPECKFNNTANGYDSYGCRRNAEVLQDGESGESGYNYLADLLPRGSSPAGSSPFGLQDVVGSVMEWTFDYYQSDYYTLAAADNPTGPDEGILEICSSSDSTVCEFRRTLRGGVPSMIPAVSYGSRVSQRIQDVSPLDPSSSLVGARCAKLANPRGVGEKCVADVDCASNQCLGDRTCGEGQ